MKHLLLLLSMLTIGIVGLSGQSSDATTPPPGSTVITADQLRADEVNHTAVFTGNVVVVGSNFTLKCQEMTVLYTKDNKVDTITAKGDVVVVQPGRVTHSGEAQYFHDEDKFVLTDQPSILDNKSKIEAPKIILFRATQQLQTEGPSTTTLTEGIGPSTPAPTPAPNGK